MDEDIPTCDHQRTEVRVKAASNGKKLYRRQCMECGQGLESWIKQKDVFEIWNVKPWDDALDQACQQRIRDAYEKRRNQYQVEREQKDLQWWAEYNAYLLTPKWRAKRERVLERDGRLCQACLKRPATQVHHTTYAHVGDEPLFELVSICDLCHEALTAIDRSKCESA